MLGFAKNSVHLKPDYNTPIVDCDKNIFRQVEALSPEMEL